MPCIFASRAHKFHVSFSSARRRLALRVSASSLPPPFSPLPRHIFSFPFSLSFLASYFRFSSEFRQQVDDPSLIARHSIHDKIGQGPAVLHFYLERCVHLEHYQTFRIDTLDTRKKLCPKNFLSAAAQRCKVTPNKPTEPRAEKCLVAKRAHARARVIGFSHTSQFRNEIRRGARVFTFGTHELLLLPSSDDALKAHARRRPYRRWNNPRGRGRHAIQSGLADLIELCARAIAARRGPFFEQELRGPGAVSSLWGEPFRRTGSAKNRVTKSGLGRAERRMRVVDVPGNESLGGDSGSFGRHFVMV